jgi:hypothetical protein
MLKLSEEFSGIHLTNCTFRFVCEILLLFVLLPVMVSGNDIMVPDTDGNVGSFTSLAIDSKDHPVVSYHDLTNRNLKLFLCNSPSLKVNDSCHTITLDNAGMVGSHTSLVLDTNNRPIISYYDALAGNLKLLRCDEPSCLSSSISVPDDSDIVGMYTSLTLDKQGNPVVSYYDSANGDLKLLHCDDPGCTGDESNNIATPDTTGDVGMYTSLTLDAVGNPVISYYGSQIGLKVLHCDDPNCDGDESTNITTPATGDVGWFSSLLLDAAGNPVIGYYNFSSGGVNILHCDDQNCTGNESKNIASPDTTSNVGPYISMALDIKGNPVVSYYDSASIGGLKILHCDDQNCAGDESGNIATPIEAAGDYGLHTSIALDSNGNPIISYYDASKGNFNILHCRDSNCKNPKKQ